MEGLIMQRADVADAEEILILQKAAFLKQAEIYNDYRLPPLIQELGDIKSQFDRYFSEGCFGWKDNRFG